MAFICNKTIIVYEGKEYLFVNFDKNKPNRMLIQDTKNYQLKTVHKEFITIKRENHD